MNFFLAILMGLIGLLLAVGGVWLIALGGSWYYLLAGIGFLLSAWLLRKRRPLALVVFALVVLGSLLWAIWEVGFDWWGLAPRGGLIVVVGLLLLIPWLRENPERLGPRRQSWRSSGFALVAALVLAVVVAAYSMMQDEHEVQGEVAAAQAAELPASEAAVPPEQWVAYGRTRARGRLALPHRRRAPGR